MAEHFVTLEKSLKKLLDEKKALAEVNKNLKELKKIQITPKEE